MTILNETVEQIFTGYSFNTHNFKFIFFLLFAIVSFILLIIVGIRQKETLWGIFSGFISVIIFFGVGLSLVETPTYKEVPQYEVIVAQDTNFYDIIDNYDIIERRGEIFILRDKGWDSND